MPVLSSNNRKVLLELARNAIKARMEGGDPCLFETLDPELTARRACFVTLIRKGALRGCVGTFVTDTPLYENVARMACAAAFQDTRFSPVTKPELSEIKIEISVLGPLEKMERVEDIVIGKHGVLVRLGNRSGTFLPQVAEEQKWSAQEFIMWCAREKARLSPAEISQAEVYLYEVEKFSE